MIVAVISDIHDNLWQLALALREIALAEAAIFCGDFCAPFTLDELAARFGQPIYAVFGNNDGDKVLHTTVASRHPNVTLLGEFGEVELGGRLIAVTHHPEIGRALAGANRYDVVCSGHTHAAHSEQIGATLWLNPGEVMGRFGHSSFALYDTDANTASLCEIVAPPIEW